MILFIQLVKPLSFGVDHRILVYQGRRIYRKSSGCWKIASCQYHGLGNPEMSDTQEKELTAKYSAGVETGDDSKSDKI